MAVDAERTAPPPRRILAVKLSSFGDIVHVTPCLRALRRAFPLADIRLAVERRWADAVRSSPHVDGLIEASSETRLSPHYLRGVRAAFQGAPGRFDLAIDLQGTRRSAAWTYLSGARHKVGRGWPRPGWQLSFAPDLDRHAVRVCADVCERIGVPVADLEPELHTTAEDELSVDRFLAAEGLPRSGFVLLNPFSRWKSKGWAEASATVLASRLRRELGIRLLITGGPDERERAGRVAEIAGPDAAASVAGRLPLAHALCLYRRARLMISCDSGPMHAAAAFGTPVVALFGPTFPERTGPWGDRHIVLQAARPPDHHTYQRDFEGRYMAALRADAVFEAVRSALEATVAGRSG